MIWLPPEYIRLQEGMRRMGVLNFVTWSDLTDKPMSAERLIEIAQQLSAELLLRRVVTFYTILLGNRPRNIDLRRQQQATWAAEMAPAGQSLQARDLILGRRRDVFVHEEQLLIVARLAMVHGAIGPALPIGERERLLLGELLFGINQLLHFGDQEKSEDLVIMLALRHLGLAGGEQPRYQLSRFFDLLVTRSRAYQGESPKLDLDAGFLSATGMTIEEYLGFALMYVAHFVDKDNAQKVATLGLDEVIRIAEHQIKDPAKLRNCQRLFTRTVLEFKEILEAEPLELPRLKTMPFRETPLLRLDDGAVIPLSFHLAMEKVATGVYWILHKHFTEQDPDHGAMAFTKYVGIIHQDYLTELLARTYSAPYVGPTRFIGEAEVISASPKPYKGKGAKPPFDGAIVGEESLVLIEIGTPMIANIAAENADVDSFHTQIEKFIAKVKQLARAIDELEQGRWVLPGVELTGIRHIYPVIGLLHPFPCLPTTLEPMRRAVTTGRRRFATAFAATEVHPLQVITDEEFEMLEPQLKARTLSLPTLLAQKVSADDSAGVSMKTFLINFLKWHEVLNEAMGPLYEAATKAGSATLATNLEGFVTSSSSG